MRRPHLRHLRHRFVVAALALLALAPDAGAVLLTYGFHGTASVLPPYDPDNVLLGQVIAGETEVTGTFRVDSAAIDLDPSLSFASYDLAFAPGALVAQIGELVFRSDTNRITLYDDRTFGSATLFDTLIVSAHDSVDPVVWPALGYRLHTELFSLQVNDSDVGDFTLLDPIAPVPPLGSFGPTNAFGQLGVLGCRLVGGATECGSDHRFDFAIDVNDVFLVPEPATSALLALGAASLAVARRRPNG